MPPTISYKPGLKIGILGGGQLARMLAMEGAKLGFDIHVFSEKADDPAAQICRNWHPGSLEDAAELKDFFSTVDAVTIESEFMDENRLLTAESATSVSVRPAVRTIAELQDRLKQKAWLERSKIRTSPFVGPLEPKDAVDFFKKHKSKVVFKKRRFGYDGYGTYIIRSQQELDGFLKVQGASLPEFIIEAFVPFKRELAVTFVRSEHGDVMAFPVVEWKAKDAKCFWVKGPASAGPGLTRLVRSIGQAIAEQKYIGAITFELFDTGRAILVNEVAPRVHNSTHYSLNACHPNQFSAHLMAVAGLRLPPKPKMETRGFAMVNLLGGSEKTAVLAASEDAHLHWYGKSEIRQGRKMGHLTTLGKSPDLALKACLKAATKIKL